MNTVSRLIDSFTPASYQLTLDLDRPGRTFHGVVTIEGDTHQDNALRLHAKDLTIEAAMINDQPAAVSMHDNDEIELTQEALVIGKHQIVITFSGKITDAMHGLYPCYFDHEGKKKELLATQFESHHAREVFPCVDEPEAKAIYDLTLATETGVEVLSNMPIKTQHEEDNRLVTTFTSSPRMSSYLLAWVIGELHKKTATTKNGVEVNVWATPAQQKDSLNFALDIATRSIEFYDEYFGTPYPLPKADHVALPDFSSGAMENWGLITYREAALLVDPSTTSVSAKHYIATVIAHELAHQWFGNLVTMKWWNDLWLNESFATLMEYIAIDALEPDWNVWLDFASNESVMALRRDAIDGVQAVQVDVDHPDEISTLFDGAIVYAKGARLLHMLRVYVGDKAFQSGLANYFIKHAYDNTAANDLWSALSASSGKDIATFMNAWISQSGYPVVEFGIDRISQEQFFIGRHENSKKLWPLPLGASTQLVPELLNDTSTPVDAPLDTRLNDDDSAHFITQYAPERLAAILNTIHDQSAVARLQLLNEQTLLARGRRISTAELLPVLSHYKNESTESVWDIISLALGEFRKFVEYDTQAEQALRHFSGQLASSLYDQLGWDEQPSEPETHTKLRATILGTMLYSERQDVVDEALRRYESVSDIAMLPAETRSLILSTVVKYKESDALIDALLDTYTNTASVDLKQDIALGLTSTRNLLTAKRLLDASKDSSIIKSQDAFRWFVYLIRNRYARETAWQWLTDNWSWVKQTFGGDKSYDDYPRYAATGLITREQLTRYIDFFTPMKSEPSLTRTIELGISEIEARVELIEQDGARVRDALRSL